MIIYLTIGLPGETSAHIYNNIVFSKSLEKRFKHLSNILMVPVQLEPASPLYENPDAYAAKTERHGFRDFYDYHRKPESNPYDYLGYVTEALEEAGGDIPKFHDCILHERCQHFCTIQFKLFGKFTIPALSRFICTITHKRWTRKGFGKPPNERRTFQ
jgi:hypothetical protein